MAFKQWQQLAEARDDHILSRLVQQSLKVFPGAQKMKKYFSPARA